mgnify:CR=1 FL=1
MNLEATPDGRGLSSHVHRGSRTRPGDALIVNLFGGPGSGKSTLASRIFHELKCAGIEAACPEEHAKLALWSGQPWLLDEQTVLLGRTWETLHALRDKVEVIIVDSPILLCSVYAGEREPDCFHHLVLDMHRRTDRINILLSRDRAAGYSMNGRRESEAEAHAADARIRQTLQSFHEPFLSVSHATRIGHHLIDFLEDGHRRPSS